MLITIGHSFSMKTIDTFSPLFEFQRQIESRLVFYHRDCHFCLSMLILCIPVLTYRFGVGNTSLPDCGCQSLGSYSCVDNNRSDILQTVIGAEIGDTVELLLCLPGSYEQSLYLSNFLSNWSMTILVDNSVVEPVFLNPSTLANPFFDKVTFGSTDFPSRQIEFLKDDENMTQELHANVVEFAEGLDVCGLRTNLTIFQTLADAARFLEVNADLPNVRIREQFCELYLFDDNVSVMPCGQQQAVYVNESIGSANLTFEWLQNVLNVYGGTGRASIDLTSSMPVKFQVNFFQGPQSDLRIRNMVGRTLDIHLENRDAASIRYQGHGKLNFFSDTNVNCTVDMNLTGDTYFDWGTSIDLDIGSIRVHQSALLSSARSTNIPVGDLVISDGCVFSFAGCATIGSVNVGEKGVLRVYFLDSRAGDIHIEIDSLYVNAGDNTTAAIQITDYSERHLEPSIFLDRIGTLYMEMHPMFESYVWARWTQSEEFQNSTEMSQFSEDITLAEQNTKIRLSSESRWDPDCTGSAKICMYREFYFSVYRFEFGLDNLLLNFFVLTGIVHLACGIPLVVWAVKNVQLLFE